MHVAESPSSSRGKLVLGLSIMAIALSFALPFRLVDGAKPGPISNEAMNLYASTAWAGWAHFIFAYAGQARGLVSKGTRKQSAIFLGALGLSLIALLGVRMWLGVGVFGALVWIYFIDHFLKAEQFFAHGRVEKETLVVRWRRSFQPILSFAWLSVVLLDFGAITDHRWTVWGVSAALSGLFLLTGGWKDLQSGDKRGTLLSLFFVSEAAVWGTIGGFADPAFLAGVYIFHIALGSFYHYFGAYFAAVARRKPGDRWLLPVTIVGINLGVGVLGYFTLHTAPLSALVPILGTEWFTLWVAMHLVSSDVFPLIKRLAVWVQEELRWLGGRLYGRTLMEFFVGVEGTYAPQLDRDTLAVTGHFQRYETDLDLIQSLGVREFRYPIPWHHVERERGRYEFGFLDGFVAAADERGLEILADPLHHTSYPQWLTGGFLNPDLVDAYPRFVEAVADRYPRLRRYAPNNEPTCTLDFCARRGWWHPYEKSFSAYARMLALVARATSLAIQALQERGKEIVHVDTAQKHHAASPEGGPSADLLNEIRFLFDELMLGRELRPDVRDLLVEHGFASDELDWFRANPRRIDVRGLNYYPLCEEDRWGPDEGRAPSAHPLGFHRLALEYVERLGLPIMLSETNIQGSIQDRLVWLKYMVQECEELDRDLGPAGFRGFAWYPAWDCMGWGMDCLLQEDESLRWQRDPQGIFWCDEHWNRNPSELSERYRDLALGSGSSSLPDYRPSDRVHGTIGSLLDLRRGAASAP